MDESPVDFSSDIGKVRALIPDVDRVDLNDTGELNYIFSDAHLQALLGLYRPVDDAPSAHIKRAAADAVAALAASEAYVSKVIRTEDLQTDGAKVANALLGRADRLRQDANQEEEEALAQGFTVVGFQPRPLALYPGLDARGWPYRPGEV